MRLLARKVMLCAKDLVKSENSYKQSQGSLLAIYNPFSPSL